MELVTGNRYYTSLPDGYVKADSVVELYEMIPRRKRYVLNNLKLCDFTILVYSSLSGRWYERSLKQQSESILKTFVRKGYLYLPKERKCSESEIKLRETHLMIEYYTDNKDIEGRQTKLKMLRRKLKEL